MNRTRGAKKTSIAGGEGKTEEFFLSYLKGIYLKRECSHSIYIPSTTHGGDPISVAKKIMNSLQNRTADAILLLLDNDRAEQYDCKKIVIAAKKKSSLPIRQKVPHLFKCIRASPCTEGLLLRISGEQYCLQSNACKDKFTRIFGKDAAHFRDADYEKNFPKDVLETSRHNISELNELIKYFELATEDEFVVYFDRLVG